MLPLSLIIAALVSWIEREQRDLIKFLREENRVLKAVLSENPAGIGSTRDSAVPARRVLSSAPGPFAG